MRELKVTKNYNNQKIKKIVAGMQGFSLFHSKSDIKLRTLFLNWFDDQIELLKGVDFMQNGNSLDGLLKSFMEQEKFNILKIFGKGDSLAFIKQIITTYPKINDLLVDQGYLEDCCHSLAIHI